MKCSTCKGPMKALFSSWYCPKDCDRIIFTVTINNCRHCAKAVNWEDPLWNLSSILCSSCDWFYSNYGAVA